MHIKKKRLNYIIPTHNNYIIYKKDYFLGDPEVIRKQMEAVANQGKQ